MRHNMKLQHAPFLSIQEGKKRIELRLYDEKRALIQIGDELEFTDVQTGDSILCEVVALHRYKSFVELYIYHDKISIGYNENDVAKPEDMLAYYSKQEQAKYGVVGLEIRLL